MTVFARIAIFGLLRPVEFLSLLRSDLKFGLERGTSATLLIALRDPKNQRSFGRSQFSIVRDPGTVAYAQWVFGCFPSGQTVAMERPTIQELAEKIDSAIGSAETEAGVWMLPPWRHY